jgi:hypothetical protein
MRLDRPFLKLPIRFSAEALAEEARAFPRSAWRPHPTGFPGNEAVRLVSPGGQPTDSIIGPMGPTEELLRSPYTMEVMSELGGVWGRSRLMGLGPGAEVPPHIDCHYYWVTHLRIHIPVVTNPDVIFICGEEAVHMEPGECWVFDSFQPHAVRNGGSQQRVHLVLDTVGSERLWDLVEAAKEGSGEENVRTLLPGDRRANALAYEQLNLPTVMPQTDMRWLFDFVVGHACEQQGLAPVLKRMDRFLCAWGAAWTRYGTDEEGLPTYRALVSSIQRDLDALRGHDLVLNNGLKLYYALDQLIFCNAFDGERVEAQSGDRGPRVSSKVQISQERSAPASRSHRELIDRPIFVVSPPRAGSALLFETLSRAPGIYTTGNESHGLIESIPGLTPRERDWDSNRLTAEDAQRETVERLAQDYYGRLMDRTWRAPSGRVRTLEKTPKNALRVPFFHTAWPDAQFVYLYRDPRETLSSMMEAWRSGGFRTYPGLPGWTGTPWSFLLVPGWRELVGEPLIEVVAHQWAITTQTMLQDLKALPREQVCAVDYADLVAKPQETMEALTRCLSLDWDVRLDRQLPISKTTVSRPGRDKWRANEQLINSVLPIVADADAEARAFVEELRQSSKAAA